MTSALRLWLVRHGETEGQSSIRYHGRNDVPLSDHGRAQVLALAPHLEGVRPVAVWHSPLQRAAESAAILARACGFPPALLRVEPRLAEIDFGQCEGMTADEIAAAFPGFWQRHRQGLVDAFPGGEARAAFAARVVAAFDDLLAAHPRGDLLVVAHRGTLRWGLRRLCRLAADAEDTFAADLGSVTEVHGDGTFRIARWNMLGDLAAT